MTALTKSVCISMELLNNLRRNLSERLVLLRDRKGWRQPDLAAACGLSSAAIAQYEQRKRWPKPEELESMADALEVRAIDLLADISALKEPTPEQALDVLKKLVEKTKIQR